MDELFSATGYCGMNESAAENTRDFIYFTHIQKHLGIGLYFFVFENSSAESERIIFAKQNSFFDSDAEFNRVIRAEAFCNKHELLNLSEEEEKQALIELAEEVIKELYHRLGKDYIALPDENKKILLESRELFAHVIERIKKVRGNVKIIINDLHYPFDNKNVKIMCVSTNANINNKTIKILV